MNIIEKQVMGKEPVVETLSFSDQKKLIHIYNWYNYVYDPESAKKEISLYLKSRNSPYLADYIKTTDNKSVNWVYALCRLYNKGTLLDNEIHDRIQQKIIEIIDCKIETINKFWLTSQRYANKASLIITMIEQELDTFYNTYSINAKSKVYEMLKSNNCSKIQAQEVFDYYLPLLAEISAVNKDEQIKEGYKRINALQLKSYMNFVQKILDDTDSFINNSTVARKPRKKKVVSTAKVTQRIQYLKEFNELKLVSIDPNNIIGSNSLWLYNVKYKKLTKLIANEGSSLGVKGTTVINVDLSKSHSKKVKKPNDVLQAVLTAGKVQLKTLIETLKTKDIPVNGRINKDTIILRSIK